MWTMNFILLSTIIASIITAEANERNVRQLRFGRSYFDQPTDHVICRYVSSHVYETMVVSKITEMIYIATKHAVKGDCSDADICKSLCVSYDNYTITNKQCQCQMDTTTRSTTISTLSTTITNTNAIVLPPTTSPAPTVSMAPSSAPSATPIATTKTEFCSNPYGNPCGPGSACTDTETGITCTPINLDGCPVGCGPNSSCKLFSATQTYECICNTGFARPQPFLPCIAKKKM